jgi:NTP pyrophosphatase (non-canonical NTP hydrolase)
MHTDHEYSLRHWQQAVDQWIHDVGVRYFSELTNLGILMEETGELARILVRRYGDQSFKPGECDDLADEMADVLFVLLCLANQTGVDLEAALARNLHKKTVRDAQRHRTNPKLQTIPTPEHPTTLDIK